MRRPNSLEQLLRRRLVRIAPARDDDRIGAIQELESNVRADCDAASRAQRTAFGGGRTAKSYQRTSSSGRCRAKSSTTQPISKVQSRSVSEGDDEVGSAHGVKLRKLTIAPATRFRRAIDAVG
jgi:hypothetical protein